MTSPTGRTTDVVERLRALGASFEGYSWAPDISEAAAEIERLRAALEPFARVWAINEPLKPDLERPFIDFCPGVWPTIGDARAAARALSPATPEGRP